MADMPARFLDYAAHVQEAIERGQRPTMVPPFMYATRRDPSRRTLGGVAAVISARLGEPFMPWQRYVADVALEFGDAPGTFRYSNVVITVPRQSGKSTLMRAIRLTRALAFRNQWVLMTAQTGKDARKQWAKLQQRVTRPDSPFAGRVTDRQSQGSEALTLVNTSAIMPFAPTPKSVHGDTVDHYDIDELWAFGTEDGAALYQALEPAQIAVPARQAWKLSTKGTHLSTLLNSEIEAGRDAVGHWGTRTAYFESASHPDGDPLDPLTMRAFHPAIGHTQTIDDIMAMANGPASVFLRAYHNRDLDQGGAAIIDLELWGDLSTDALDLPEDGVHLAIAVAEDRSSSSIWASWDHAGTPHVALVATAPGQAWLAPATGDLVDRLQPERVNADNAGWVRTSTAELRRAGVEVKSHNVPEYVTAWTTFAGLVTDGQMSHEDAPEIEAAIKHAVLRPMGGGRAPDARKSTGPIHDLQAAALALASAVDAEETDIGIHLGRTSQ